MPEAIPAIVLGGSGYVGGELLRLLASHPCIRPAAVVSRSRRREPLEAVFPNLRGAWPELRFTSLEKLPDTLGDRCAIFSTAAHGASARLVDRALGICEERHCAASVVDGLGGFSFSRRRRVRGRVRARARRPGSHADVPESVAGARHHPQAPPRRSSRMLRDRHAARQYAPDAPRTGRSRPDGQRGDGQYRGRPRPQADHPPPHAACQHVRLQAARASPCAGGGRDPAGADRPGRSTALRPRFRAVRARNLHGDARAAARRRPTPDRCGTLMRTTMRRRRSCTWSMFRRG